MEQKKISQNVKTLIGEIGERMSLFRLYHTISKHEKLEIYKNYTENGYDLGIIYRDSKKEKKVKIEVKTRQHLITTTNKKHICHFTISKNEKERADFLIAYWLEWNSFFIVPMKSDEIKERKNVFQFTVRKMREKDAEKLFSNNAIPYLENWNALLEFIYKDDVKADFPSPNKA